MGILASTAALKITINDTSVSYGLYAADGSIRATVVSGTTYTGLYAPDGSLNIIPEDGTLYHPCGAIRGIIPYGAQGLYSPQGALYMDGLDEGFNNLETETGYNLLQEDNDFLLLE